MGEPYYADASTTLYLGDMRQLIAERDLQADLIVADPPYGGTALRWDRWPDGWVAAAAAAGQSMWCFGSLRMFMDHAADFAAWTMSHDVIWEKHNGSGFAADRFRRVHEQVSHWYQGRWADICHEVPRVPHAGPYRGTRKAARAGSAHLGENNGHNRPWLDTGLRLARSVLKVRSMHGRAIHPTEKPLQLLDSLIQYGCPSGGVVLDPFAGSGSTAAAARAIGCRAVLIERDERYCEQIARRLSAEAVTGNVR